MNPVIEDWIGLKVCLMPNSGSLKPLFVGLTLSVLLSACAAPGGPRGPVQAPSTPPPPAEPSLKSTPLEMGRPVTVRPLPQERAEPNPSLSTQQPVKSPVVVALLRDVERLQGSGEFDQAAARVERGLRIAPKDARLWQRLATIRLQQQRPEQAETLAKKSNSLARGQRAMQSLNWRIIAQSRAMRGDAQGADQARLRAEQLN